MEEQSLGKHLVYLLQEGGAHATFDAAVKGIPPPLRGKRPRGLPHSPWELVEHMRIAQRDILDFSRNPKYALPKWPEGYWPPKSAPPSAAAWTKSIRSFRDDLKSMCNLVTDPATNLFAKIPWGDGQTILREALLAADHTSYHVGQLILVRRLLGIWKE
jgi:hypothetical protein